MDSDLASSSGIELIRAGQTRAELLSTVLLVLLLIGLTSGL